jgi:hypothetical protein
VSKTFDFTAANGVPFRASIEAPRAVPADGRLAVAFYDRRYPHTEHGQFVSDYFVSTVLDIVGGLMLYGGVDDWVVDADSMAEVQHWVREEEGSKATEWADLSDPNDPRIVSQVHLDADVSHVPVPDDVDDPNNCETCGLALTWDGKRHGRTEEVGS